MSTSTGVNPFPDDARLWNAVDTFRLLALGYAVAVFALTRGEHAHLWTGWAVLGVLTAWTVFVVTTRLRRGRPPTRGLLAADLAVACAAVLSTAAVDSPAVIAAGGATLPGIWAAAPVLAWAVLEGRRAGLAAACCVALADLVEVRRLSASTLDAIVLLLIAAACSAGRSSCSAPAGPNWRARSPCRRRLASASGWPRTSTTRRSRRSPTCAAAARRSAARPRPSASSPASRRSGCGRSWHRRPRPTCSTPSARSVPGA